MGYFVTGRVTKREKPAMGRKPVGKKAMTDAQRQQRHRARTKVRLVAKGAKWDKAERRKRRLAKLGEQIVPAPPGITYWREVAVTGPEGEAKMIWTPVTQPAASVMLHELSNGEIEGLLYLLEHEQERREGRRPTIGALEKGALQVMLHSRHPGHMAKLEMFARTPRAGWDIWGNEICVSLGPC
jgi:hypothetical protein